MKSLMFSQKSAERFQKAINSYLVGDITPETKLNLLELGTMIDQMLIDYHRDENDSRNPIMKRFGYGETVEVIDTAARRYLGKIFSANDENLTLECEFKYMVDIPHKNIVHMRRI